MLPPEPLHFVHGEEPALPSGLTEQNGLDEALLDDPPRGYFCGLARKSPENEPSGRTERARLSVDEAALSRVRKQERQGPEARSKAASTFLWTRLPYPLFDSDRG